MSPGVEDQLEEDMDFVIQETLQPQQVKRTENPLRYASKRYIPPNPDMNWMSKRSRNLAVSNSFRPNVNGVNRMMNGDRRRNLAGIEEMPGLIPIRHRDAHGSQHSSSTIDDGMPDGQGLQLGEFPGPAGFLQQGNSAQDDEFYDDSILPATPWLALCADRQLTSCQLPLKMYNVMWIRSNAVKKSTIAWKVPFLAAVVKVVHNSYPDPYVMLGDKSGSIGCTISRALYEQLAAILVPGSAVTLLRVGVLLSGGTARRVHLNIVPSTILSIYSYDLWDADIVRGTRILQISQENLHLAIEECNSFDPYESPDDQDSPLDKSDMEPSDTSSFCPPDGASTSHICTTIPSGIQTSQIVSCEQLMVGSSGGESNAHESSFEPTEYSLKRKSSSEFEVPEKVSRIVTNTVMDEEMDTSDLQSSFDAEFNTDMPATNLSVPDQNDSTDDSTESFLEGIDLSLFFQDF